jgi:hypothetical protein
MSFSIQPELIELASRPPGKRQWRTVLLLLMLCVGGCIGFLPFVEAPVSPATGIIAIQSAGLAIVHLLIALLLLGQLQLRRSTPVVFLSCGFLVSSLNSSVSPRCFHTATPTTGSTLDGMPRFLRACWGMR